MLVIIEVNSTCGIAKRVWLRPGERIVVGNTERSDLVLERDEQLSDRHFTISCDDGDCHLWSLAEAATTHLNGKEVSDAQVHDQDVILAGNSTFHIHIDGAPAASAAREDIGCHSPVRDTATSPASSTTCLHRVGGWGFNCIPDQWVATGQGLRWNSPEHEPGIFSVTEGELADFVDFARYVQLLMNRLIQPALALEPTPPEEVDILGADQAFESTLRFTGPQGQRIVQRQLFVRQGNRLGSALFTTQEPCMDRLDEAFRQIRNGLSFRLAG